VNASWKYETAEDLDRSLTERLKHFPREPDLFVYALRSFGALLIRSWLKTYHRLTITGQENLPLNKSFVLVANHSSHLDTLCLLSALPLQKLHRAFPAAAADYFFESIPRIWIAAVVVNALPFARQVQIRQSLAVCEQLLENPGNILILFPEGTRSRTGELSHFKPGVGLLLAGRSIPVIPCYLNGAFRAWRKGQWLPRPGRISLAFGTAKSYEHLPAGKESACVIAQELHHAVAELSQHL
jgi:1-acyl-sn-glycerol-3-phosphate acyltransferase